MNSVKPPRNKKWIGILGGTFDPIHNGHIEPAISVAKTLPLDELRLLPAHIPPHKGKPSASPAHREKMANLVCLHNPIFTLDNRELRSHKTSYSVHTLKALKEQTPNAVYFFIMGMDSLQSFTTWHLWEDILKYSHLIVNIRPGYSNTVFNEDTQRLLKKYQCHDIEMLSHAANGYIYIHEGIEKNISSTQIRQNVVENSEASSLLPSYIASYIKQHALYK